MMDKWKGELRYCPSCKTHKESVAFYRNKGRKDGLNGHCKVCVKIRSNKQNLLLAHKKNHLVTRYHMTFEEYTKIHRKQNGLCAICGRTINLLIKGKADMAHVDHDHTTGKVRGLLCNLCNNGLGCFKDSLHLLREAVQYLMA